ncbi:MAG: hypothetical protein KME19_08900 [Microcoleus vaginatus WJT46-NPBG5]|jgi:erythromycin esterase-like protein|nr:hypothetical protein [Microcoleus vaginatus WJT46-NPBG5]MBW4680218.1 hypothetical protein [Microcoleus vaginatus WJT46-NPBG5]
MKDSDPQLAKQLYAALSEWYGLTEYKDIFQAPFDSLQENEREVLAKCAAHLKQAFTKEHLQKIEMLRKQLTECRQLAFNLSEGLSRVSADGTHREKSEAMQRAIAMLLPVARPLIFPSKNDDSPLDEIPF